MKNNGKLNGKTILAVLAHPDDESFGMGGTLAFYASQGVDVHLVCATKGEVGEVPPEFMEGFGSVAERREAELRCAAGVLGLASVIFLGYRDSGMPGSPDNEHPQALVAAPQEEVAAKIIQHIRKLRPQVVLTFDPVGGYHHPDHIAIHQATLRAFHAAGDAEQAPDGMPAYQPEKLYYHIFPRGLIRIAVRVARLVGKDASKFGRNQDIDLQLLADDPDYPAHARINYRSVANKKQQAGECHASQLDMGRSNRLIGWFLRFRSSTDHFMRAYPPAPSGMRVRNLFDR